MDGPSQSQGADRRPRASASAATHHHSHRLQAIRPDDDRRGRGGGSRRDRGWGWPGQRAARNRGNRGNRGKVVVQAPCGPGTGVVFGIACRHRRHGIHRQCVRDPFDAFGYDHEADRPCGRCDPGLDHGRSERQPLCCCVQCFNGGCVNSDTCGYNDGADGIYVRGTVHHAGPTNVVGTYRTTTDCLRDLSADHHFINNEHVVYQ